MKPGGTNDSGNIEQTIAALRQMTAGQLRERYQEVFGEPSRSGNRQFLFKRIAWRIQSLAEGGLSERARRRAEELARDADIRTTLPRPPKGGRDGHTVTLQAPRSVTAHDRLPLPGTVLTRRYRGQQVEVKVLACGFEYAGQTYRSLSAIAKAITGTHWNGHLFFGLTTHKRDRCHE
jgi:hypothetical protein